MNTIVIRTINHSEIGVMFTNSAIQGDLTSECQAACDSAAWNDQGTSLFDARRQVHRGVPRAKWSGSRANIWGFGIQIGILDR